jgi:CheY-like chemotaxis protein
VDDEPSVRQFVHTVLANAGHEVTAAPNGFRAIAVLERETFDVVMTDVMMPKMDGHELVRLTAARHPGTHYVLMSGYDNAGCETCPVGERCHRLSKPFTAAAVLAAVSI